LARHLPVNALYCKNCPSPGELVKSMSASVPNALTPLPAKILTSALLPVGIGSVNSVSIRVIGLTGRTIRHVARVETTEFLFA